MSHLLPRITAGPVNVLYHYVQMDIGHGTIMASTSVSPSEPIIQAFRRACLSIHDVLQNTIRLLLEGFLKNFKMFISIYLQIPLHVGQ